MKGSRVPTVWKNLIDRRTVITTLAITLLFTLALRGSERVAEACVESMTWVVLGLVAGNAAQKSLRYFGRSKKKVSRTPPAT
jgi:hypothetical protein